MARLVDVVSAEVEPGSLYFMFLALKSRHGDAICGMHGRPPTLESLSNAS